MTGRKCLGMLVAAASISLVLGACGSDDDDGANYNGGSSGSGGTGGGGSPEPTGSVCEDASDCYPDVVDGELQGDAMCLDRVRGGYCTHTCTVDEDCCAAVGECETELAQVCSPFESTGKMMCFLSCEPEDMKQYEGSPDWEDDNEFCQREASADFICRSSGGGAKNRKICVPGDCDVGAACRIDDDCEGDLECIDTFLGGYCGKANCTGDADCPNGSLCAKVDGGSPTCLRKCDTDSDCSFCRPWDSRTTCSDDVTFVDDGTSGTVCVPDLR